MKIRAYCEGDYQSILDIYADAKLDEVIWEQSNYVLVPLDVDKKRQELLFSANIFVAEIDGQVLGYGAYKDNEIRSIFLHKKARGKGIGKSLLKYLLAKVDYPACLTLVASNQAAKKLYEKFGFKTARAFQSDYHGVPVALVEMQLNTYAPE